MMKKLQNNIVCFCCCFCQLAEIDYHLLARARNLTIDFKYDFLCICVGS